MCAVSFSCCNSFHIITQLAALCLKLCHRKNKYFTSFTVLKRKAGMKYRDESDMKQEKRVKDDLRDAN